MKLPRLWMIICTVALTAFPAGTIWAEQQADATVDIELKDVPIKEAIEKLFAGTQVKYTVDENVKGKVVELKLKGITLKQALDALCEAAGLTYTVKDGVYSIKPLPSKDDWASAQKQAALPDAQPEKPSASEEPATKTQDSEEPVYFGQLMDETLYNPYYGPTWYDFQVGGLRYIGGRWRPPLVYGGPPTVMRVRPLLGAPGFRVSPHLQRLLYHQYMIPFGPGR